MHLPALRALPSLRALPALRSADYVLCALSSDVPVVPVSVISNDLDDPASLVQPVLLLLTPP